MTNSNPKPKVILKVKNMRFELTNWEEIKDDIHLLSILTDDKLTMVSQVFKGGAREFKAEIEFVCDRFREIDSLPNIVKQNAQVRDVNKPTILFDDY